MLACQATARQNKAMQGLGKTLGYGVFAPDSNQCLMSSRSASVMPVALFMGMILVTTTSRHTCANDQLRRQRKRALGACDQQRRRQAGLTTA